MKFNATNAFEFGQRVIDKIKRDNEKPVRIRIVLNKDIVFQYLMEGKVGVDWLNKKQRTVEKTHLSSYDVFLHQDDYLDLVNDESYAICGGGYPIIDEETYIECIIISGLTHEQDHQLIMNILKEMNKL